MGLFVKLQTQKIVCAVDSKRSSGGTRCSLDPAMAPGWFVVAGSS